MIQQPEVLNLADGKRVEMNESTNNKTAEKATAFLKGLANLCEKYNAVLFYTIDDTGIIIEIDGKKIFEDYLCVDAPDLLRKRAKKIKE